jgi:hypothetical protein
MNRHEHIAIEISIEAHTGVQVYPQYIKEAIRLQILDYEKYLTEELRNATITNP